MTTLVAAHADPAGAALDVSGYARHVTQGTTAAKPAFDATVGLFGGLTFDGGDWLANAAPGAVLRNVAGATLFVVCQTAAPGALRYVLTVHSGTSTTQSRVLLCRESAGTRTLQVQGRRLDNDSIFILGTAANVFSAGGWAVQAAHIDYANSNANLYHNAQMVATTTTWGTDGNTSDTNSNGLALGSLLAGNASITGQMMAAFICVPMLSQELYLRCLREWAVPLSKGLIAA
jgi:hypothetical protein